MSRRYSGFDDPQTTGLTSLQAQGVSPTLPSGSSAPPFSSIDSSLPPWRANSFASSHAASGFFQPRRRRSSAAPRQAFGVFVPNDPSGSCRELSTLLHSHNFSSARSRTNSGNADLTASAFKSGVSDPFFTPSPLPPWLQEPSRSIPASVPVSVMPDSVSATINPNDLSLASKPKANSPSRPRRRSMSPMSMEVDQQPLSVARQGGSMSRSGLARPASLQPLNWPNDATFADDFCTLGSAGSPTSPPHRRGSGRSSAMPGLTSQPTSPQRHNVRRRVSGESLFNSAYDQGSSSASSSTSTSRISSPLDSDFGFGLGRGFSPSLSTIASSPASSGASFPRTQRLYRREEKEAPAAPDWWKEGFQTRR